MSYSFICSACAVCFECTEIEALTTAVIGDAIGSAAQSS